MTIPAGTSLPGLRVVFISPVIRLGPGRNIDAQSRRETSSISVSPRLHSLAANEAGETDKGGLVTAEWGTTGCTLEKNAIFKVE